MADHDNAYKLVFSFRRVMEDLLHAFVHEDWLLEVDLDTLEKVNASHVSDRVVDKRLQDRESGLVWRVRWKGGDGRWLYIYLLLEFQSTIDPFMGLRVMAYVALLQQDMVRQGALTPSGKLPPLLVLVLYNGLAEWSAARDVADLIEQVPGLEKYSPRLQYLLLDERRLAESDLATVRNVAAAMFRIEKAPTLEGAEALAEALLEWLKEPEHAALLRALGVWMSEVVLPARLPGVKIPKIADLLEVKKMIADHAIDWTREWKERGLAEGRAEGRAKGIEEGLVKGRTETLGELRRVAQETLEARFGALPRESRERLAALDSVEALGRLIAHSNIASSLAELGLT